MSTGSTHDGDFGGNGTGHGRGPDDEPSAKEPPSNVITFPGDWFGSKDDLTAIGSIADRRPTRRPDLRVVAPDADGLRDGGRSGDRPEPAPEIPVAATAADFWGIDPVESVPVVAVDPVSDGGVVPGRRRPPRVTRGVRLSGFAPIARPGLRTAVAAAMAVLLIVCAVVGFATGGQGSSRRAAFDAHATAPGAGSAAALSTLSVVRLHPLPGLLTTKRTASLTPHHSAQRAHKAGGTSPRAAADHHTTRTSTPAAPLSSGTSEAVSEQSPSVTYEPAATSFESGSGAAASGSSGPTGTGGVVGTNCDPQCG